MYQIRTAGISKKDQVKRWALPDRVFFACGACHILAYAFLERFDRADCNAMWIKPATGYIGNHVFVHWNEWVFDYHGYSSNTVFLKHTWKRARQRWPGWDATLVALPRDVLISESRSREIEGLWLREPGQFLHNALFRARRFVGRMPEPKCARKSSMPRAN